MRRTILALASSLLLLTLFVPARPAHAAGQAGCINSTTCRTWVHLHNDTDQFVWVDYTHFQPNKLWHNVEHFGLIGPHSSRDIEVVLPLAFTVNVYAYVKKYDSASAPTLCSTSKIIGNNHDWLNASITFTAEHCAIRVQGFD